MTGEDGMNYQNSGLEQVLSDLESRIVDFTKVKSEKKCSENRKMRAEVRGHGKKLVRGQGVATFPRSDKTRKKKLN